MNWLDVALVILLVGSVASAFSKGFVRESIGLGELPADRWWWD